MIGLEYILHLYKVQHSDLADELGIVKQNINRWIKGERKIPIKYLPILSEKFKIPEEYFTKEIDKYDEASIQITKVNNGLSNLKEEVYFTDSANKDFVRREVIYDGNLIPNVEDIKYTVESGSVIREVKKAS